MGQLIWKRLATKKVIGESLSWVKTYLSHGAVNSEKIGQKNAT
jgi:hypothetical protein